MAKMSSHTVRRLTASDVTLAAALVALTERAPAPPEQLGAWLSASQNIMVGALVDGAPAGMAFGYRLPRPDAKGDMVLLYSLDVFAGYRRRGIATEIIAEMRAICPGRLWLLTNAGNSAAMALYEAAGGTRWHDDDVLWVWPELEDR